MVIARVIVHSSLSMAQSRRAISLQADRRVINYIRTYVDWVLRILNRWNHDDRNMVVQPKSKLSSSVSKGSKYSQVTFAAQKHKADVAWIEESKGLPLKRASIVARVAYSWF